jgi:predicted transposase/invertase (TIGR01784 family)
MVRRAFTALETLSAEEKNRILAQKREESLMNERYELAAARKKGRKEGRKEGRGEREKEIAASLLNEGIPVEMIAKCTGLSSGEIKKLKKGKK